MTHKKELFRAYGYNGDYSLKSTFDLSLRHAPNLV